MSRNASGTYTLPSGNPVVSGTLIEASWANTTLSDLASAMTDSLSRTGQGGMQAALRLYDGTSTVPGLAWANETTSGWYRAGAGDMRLVVTGSEVMKYLATGVTVTGTLAVSGAITATGGVTGNASTATALQTARTIWGQSFNGTANVSGALTGVTDITASGNGSFGGTLSVTGTTTLTGAATLTANPTLSAGTANGVAYLNGSKVLTTGSALTFDGTQLSVGGGTGLFRLNASSSDYSLFKLAVSGTNYANIGVGTSGELVMNGNSLQIWQVGGSEQMRLTSTGLGIGTSSPAYKLDVNISSGSVRIRSNTGTANSAGYLLGNSYRSWSILSESGAGNFIISDETTAGTPTRLTLDSSGNLGLGVTPSAWGSTFKSLQVGAAASFAGLSNRAYMSANWYYDGTNDKYINADYALRYKQAFGAHSWDVAASGAAGGNITFTQAMTLDASGNLGLGTSSPSAIGAGYPTLDIRGSTGGGQRWGNSTDSAYIYSNSTETNLATATAKPLLFSTNGSERARIDSSGNLLVGTTSLLTGSPRLNVSSTGGYTATFNQTDNTDRVSIRIQNKYAQSAQNATMIQFIDSGGTERGSVKTTGTATSYNTSSDYRLKEDVQPMTGALAKVAALKPVTYKWKSGGSDGEGFIAHELAEVCPHAVTGEKDAVDADGNPVYQGIDTSFLVATLTAAIQEQQAIIEQLKADVAALKASA